ncbi:hypothetical protein DV737_g2146, partial [Chaetothyriales sp. CBS 132003]
MSTSLGLDANAYQDEDERSTTAQLVADLKEQVQRAEQASEQYRKHLELMQQRLDESNNDQTLAEERDFQRQTQLDRLQAEVKDAARQRRELEIAHQSETRMLLQERERQASREADLQTVINRLNETLRNKGLERLLADDQAGKMLPSAVDVCNVFAASASMPANYESGIRTQVLDSAVMNTHIQTLQEKDSTIEQLRLELADLHLKAAEQEHLGDSHLQVLEQRVTELRVHNARLQEENESFQMLLSEKTLKGDFMAESREMSTLAEELETANLYPDAQTDAFRKLEAELKVAREENKGLTLYIDKIIGRLLQHDGFEHIVDSSDQELPPAPLKNPIQLNQIEKALPAPPGDDFATPTTTIAVTSAAQSFLKRAGSLVSRPGNVRPARPMSVAQPLAAPSANENPRREKTFDKSLTMAPIIHCVRHAQGFHNLGTEFHSLPDPLLTPKGEEQCETLKNTHFLDQSRLSLIAASPLKRTLHTALLTFRPALASKGSVAPEILAVPDAQETSDAPCDTGSDLDKLREFVKEQGWPVDLSLLSEDWNVKALSGRYSPHSDAVAARAKTTRQLLRRKARELVAAGQPDGEIVVVTHGGFLHYLTNDWENAVAQNGTGWANCETRSYTFTNLGGSGDGDDEDEAMLVETVSSRQKRGLSHPTPDPETQKRLFIEGMEGWEAQGYQRPDTLEIPAETAPTETEREAPGFASAVKVVA